MSTKVKVNDRYFNMSSVPWWARIPAYILAIPAVVIILLAMIPLMIAAFVSAVAMVLFIPSYFLVKRFAIHQGDEYDSSEPLYDADELLEELLQHPNDTLAVWEPTIRETLENE